jgi:hypothetical protein
LTGGCDTSTTGSRELSIFAIGLGLSDSSPDYVYNLQYQKFGTLEQTLNNAKLTEGGTVYNTLHTYFNNAASDVAAAKQAGLYTPTFYSEINCALNQIASADGYLRNNLSAFSSNLVTMGPGGGNPNPAGEIDGRLASWYTAINTMYAGNQPYTTWPLAQSSVPACGPTILSFSAAPDGSGAHLTANVANDAICYYTSLDLWNSGYGQVQSFYSANGVVGSGLEDISTYPLPSIGPPGYGTDTVTLTCYGPPGTIPAVAGPLLITNPNLTLPATTLSIDQFYVTQDDSGVPQVLNWVTSHSTSATLCSLIDEFGTAFSDESEVTNAGAPDPNGPGGNQPMTGLNANSSTYPFPYTYPSYYSTFCSPDPPPSDTITLSCTDSTIGGQPQNGTAIKTLTLYPYAGLSCDSD